MFAASLADGILLLGVGSGRSKVFELFDRHALAGLGHPADIEKIRQAAIDAAHLEAFTRAPEDVSLRRLVSFGLGPQLKSNFEQIYTAPFLVELVLAEVGASPADDYLLRLHFDGKFSVQTGGVMVVTDTAESESAAQTWLASQLPADSTLARAADVLLQAWWCVTANRTFGDSLPNEDERRASARKAAAGKVIEAGWLARKSARAGCYAPLTARELGLDAA